MSGYLVLAGIIVALMVAYQIYISRRVSRSPYYSDRQRWVQLIMIWMMPAIGASLCHLMLKEAEAGDVSHDQGGGNDDDFGGDNGSYDSGGDGGGSD